MGVSFPFFNVFFSSFHLTDPLLQREDNGSSNRHPMGAQWTFDVSTLITLISNSKSNSNSNSNPNSNKPYSLIKQNADMTNGKLKLYRYEGGMSVSVVKYGAPNALRLV